QFIGGMTMGLSMALLEESILDPHLGDWVNKDLADYHIATYADIGDIDATWLDEDDTDVNPMGTKGIGEIGIVGAAAAVANAVFHAPGVRVRAPPITPPKLIGALCPRERRSKRRIVRRMPRIQVSLPDDLYRAAKEPGLPASELLQEAVR